MQTPFFSRVKTISLPQQQAMPTWLPLAGLALLLRFPLITLPGAGRDEALYFYWSRHLEPAYSPLMQFITAFFDFLPILNLLAMRMPSLIGGVLVIYLLDKLLQERQAIPGIRWLLLSAVAFSPWQFYTGTILHPDNWLLVSVLIFLIASYRRQHLIIALAAGLSLWVKPSGLLLLPVAGYWFFFYPSLRAGQRIFYLSLIAILILPIFLSFQPEMIQAISEFGKISSQVSLAEALSLQIFSVLLLGGIYFPALALVNAWRNRKLLLDFNFRHSGDHLSLITGMIFFAGFGAAALFMGQIKGNWILPALVILLPASLTLHNRTKHFIGLSTAALLGLLLMLAFSRPAMLDSLTAYFPGIDRGYAMQAGSREARISATATWAERIDEYQSNDSFFEKIETAWQQAAGTDWPAVIVSDDYGLAAQVAFAWDQPDQRLLLPEDGIFFRSWPKKGQQALPGKALVILVHHQPETFWQGLKSLKMIAVLDHPQNKRKVYIAFSDGVLNQTPESGTMIFEMN